MPTNPNILIQRLPLTTSPTSRQNSYNHHARAPWLAKTGYLTPLYLHHRKKALLPFNMARWITPRISKLMLQQPIAILNLDQRSIEALLTLAAKCHYDVDKAKRKFRTPGVQRFVQSIPKIASSERSGYFMRMSACSPKDVDGGNLEAVHTVEEALVKIICSKRTVQALLDVHAAGDYDVDNKIYFFPYHTGLDRLSEWRCYIYEGEVVAVSQTRFYAHNHAYITDEALRRLVRGVRDLWNRVKAEVNFDSCVLDIYAEVSDPSFLAEEEDVKLIEINPWGPHLGSGSLLFHWLDDSEILTPSQPNGRTVVRLVEPFKDPGEPPPKLSRQEAYAIGRGSVIEDELRCLEARGLASAVLGEEEHERFMRMPVPGRGGSGSGSGITTRAEGLARFLRPPGGRGGGGQGADCGIDSSVVEDGGGLCRSHPRFLKLQALFRERGRWRAGDDDDDDF